MQDKQTLLRLEAISGAIAEGAAREVILRRIVDSVQLLGYDRIRIDLLGTDGTSIATVAQQGFGETGPQGHAPVTEDEDLLRLQEDPRPAIILDASREHGCVPVLWRGKVLGKIVVEKSRGSLDPESLNEIAPFASQVALAQAMALAEPAHREEPLETLQKATVAIALVRNRNELSKVIVEQAVKLLGTKSGGLYEYRPEKNDLIVIADSSRPKRLGKTLKLGEGLAGRLISSGEPYMAVSDYSLWEGRASIDSSRRELGAVLAVPLIWEGATLGSLYVDDEAGRSFSAADIRMLRLFAEQAAICLNNSARLESDARKLWQLELLAQRIQEITGNLDAMSWRRRLEAIAKSAAEILDAETSGVFRVRNGELVLEASYGQRTELVPGKIHLKVHNEPHGGLTGWIAYHGKLFNATGESLNQHPAVAHSASHALSGHCYSLLAIPLKRRVGGEEELIGLIRVDNKIGKNPALSRFTGEDESILTVFAEAALNAIESAELVDRLRERSDFQKRLISSSPDGVIAVDRKGLVTEFNKRAEEILGYAREEVLARPVSGLYYDPGEARRIGRMLLESPDSHIRDYETIARSQSGERIPIRYSSTWLFNTEGERLGSIGYFEDLRSLKARESRERLLLRASGVVGRAKALDEALQRLAELMVSQLNRSFCNILIKDEDSDVLVLRAASRSSESAGYPKPLRINPPEWPGLAELLSQGLPAIREWDQKENRPNLKWFSRLLGLEANIRSLLIVPLKIGNRLVGQLNLGDFRKGSDFSPEEVDLAAAIAAQITGLLDRFQLLESKARREKLLPFYRMSSELMTLENPREILARIIKQILTTSGASWVSILLIDRAGRALNSLNAGHHFSVDPSDPLPIRPDGISMKVMRTGQAFPIESVERARESVNSILISRSIQAAICLPFSLPGKRMGVMWIHYDEPHDFPEPEIGALQLYANQAAAAYDSSRRLERLGALRELSGALAEAGDVSGVLREIVKGAQKVLKADAALFWVYDEKSKSFILEDSVYAGDHLEAWSEFNKKGPDPAGTPFQILQREWILIEDAASPPGIAELDPNTRNFLGEIGGRGFLGVVLKSGRERLGVLCAIYVNPIRFDDEESDTAQSVASQAALFLKKARLFQQVQRAQGAAKIVTRLTLLEDSEGTLVSIAREIRKALDCGAVVLFKYDQDAGQLVFPPAMAGVPELTEGESPTLALAMVEKDRRHVVLDTAKDEVFKNSPFYKTQGIRTCVAFPLKAAGRKVGVMFVNYRNPRSFTDEELANMELFANQAAVAIRNSQLFEDRTAKLKQQEALAALSRELLHANSLQETMDRVVESAARALHAEFCSLVLPDSQGRLVLKSAVGWDPRLLSSLSLDPGRNSQTGYTIQERKPVAVHDYRTEKRFIVPEIVFHYGIQSGLSVPMFRQDEIVGAVLIHTKWSRQFTEGDAIFLSLIANQAAIALERAQQFEASQRKGAYLGALYTASKAITAQFGLERSQVLEQIIQPAMKGIVGLQGRKATLGMILLYDEVRDALVLESVYPPEAYTDLALRIGERLPLLAARAEGQRGRESGSSGGRC